MASVCGAGRGEIRVVADRRADVPEEHVQAMHERVQPPAAAARR